MFLSMQSHCSHPHQGSCLPKAVLLNFMTIQVEYGNKAIHHVPTAPPPPKNASQSFLKFNNTPLMALAILLSGSSWPTNRHLSLLVDRGKRG